MSKTEVSYSHNFEGFCEALGAGGSLLVSLDRDGKPNAMTIGWALLGVVWSRPVCAVLVRPSRYTWECIEATGDFTVNVPPPGLEEEVLFCGTRSGRDYDKFEHCGFTATAGHAVKSPGIEECVATYECVVIQKNDVIPEQFAPQITEEFYSSGDFHRVYYGEIVGVYADPDHW